MLQAGDCAEPFGAAAVAGARSKMHIMHRLGVALERSLGVPVLRIGRLAASSPSREPSPSR